MNDVLEQSRGLYLRRMSHHTKASILIDSHSYKTVGMAISKVEENLVQCTFVSEAMCNIAIITVKYR